MDLRNYEFYEDSGLPLVGATVTVYEGTLSHPPVTLITATTTNTDGMWQAAGLSETPKDVKVTYLTTTKWYKGMTRHGVSAMWHEEPPTFKHAATPGVVAAGTTKGYFKSDGQWYSKTGSTETRYHNTGTPIVAGNMGSFPSCRIYHNAVQSIPNSAVSPVFFNSEEWDTDSMHSTVSNTDRITINTAGKYRVWWTITFAAFVGASNLRLISVALNGGTIYDKREMSVDSQQWVTNGVLTLSLAATYVLTIAVFQATGGALNVLAGSVNGYGCAFGADWIGP